LSLLIAGIAPVSARAQAPSSCAAQSRCGWFLATDFTVGWAVSRAEANPFSTTRPLLLTGGAALMRTAGRTHAIGVAALTTVEWVESSFASPTDLATRVRLSVAARYRYALGTRSYLEAQAGAPLHGRGGLSHGQVSPMVGLMWQPVPLFGIGARLATENYHAVGTPINERRWYVETRLGGRYGAVGAGAAALTLLLGLLTPVGIATW
jgi:hypothetical protein